MATITELRKAVEDAQASEAAARKTFESRKGNWKDETAEKAALMRAAKARHAAERSLNEETLRAEGALAARGVTVTREEPTYRPDGGPRFFHDLHAASLGGSEARERLERNNAEVRETRATGDTAAAGFEAPVWMSELWSDFPRVANVLESAIPHSPMPSKGFTASIPMVTTGLGTASQAKDGSGVNEDADNSDVASDTADSEVVTVAGNIDVGLQVFERSAPAGDVYLGQDLLASIDEEIDRQLAVGDPGSPVAGPEHYGLLNVPGATAVDWTESSPTAQKFLAELAKAMSAYHDARKAYPTHVVLSPSRAAWALSGITDAAAPLFQNGGFYAGGMGADAAFPAGTLLGMRVLATGSVPVDLDTDHDFVALWRPSDAAFAASSYTFQARQVSGLNGKIQVRLTAYQESYAWLHRKPESVAIITGTGLVKAY